jgi:glucose-1-phosphate thymidylyltransferase
MQHERGGEERAMKGAILGGGLGTRMMPATAATNKHLLPLFMSTERVACMVEYPIRTLVRAGVKDVILVTGGPHAGHYIRVLGTGKRFGLDHLEYTYQEEEGGIAQALSLCEDFADGEPLLVVLGDNITNADLGPAVREFAGGAHVFLKEVPDPHRFGVPVFEGDQIVEIIEKPEVPASNYAVTGFYIYDRQVFDAIRSTRPSGRGELEITDVNRWYLKRGELHWSRLEGFWSDAGTPMSWLVANLLLAREAGLEPETLLTAR